MNSGTEKEKNRRITKNSSIKSGMKPGSLVHVGVPVKEGVRISLVKYNELDYTEEPVSVIGESLTEPYDGVRWIKVEGINDTAAVERLGELFNVNPFVQEDILNTNSRPKLDEYEEYIYILVKSLAFEKEKIVLHGEQVSIVLGNDFVMSFCESDTHMFEPVVRRIKAPKSLMRKRGCDYLAYALVDSIVDNYFQVLENIEDNLDELEDELISKPKQGTLRSIYGLKKELILLRKSVWPLREVLNLMQSGDSEFIEKATEMYLRDVYDHVIQVIDTTQLFVDIVTGMLDTYLSSVNNRMSEVMKVLTIFSTIFIPVTFLAGVYGMNFAYMPELNQRWAYPLFWTIVLAVISTMLIVFKKRNWF
ncbi:MAG: magnesium and cobalt transport protein CorA [Firmicutes bacterium]|nr:magnesium and cobalt transport protein CorA [Bacillota bacterium]